MDVRGFGRHGHGALENNVGPTRRRRRFGAHRQLSRLRLRFDVEHRLRAELRIDPAADREAFRRRLRPGGVGRKDRQISQDRLGNHSALFGLDPEAHSDVGRDVHRLPVPHRRLEPPCRHGGHRGIDESRKARRERPQVPDLALPVDPADEEHVTLLLAFEKRLRIYRFLVFLDLGAFRLGERAGRAEKEGSEKTGRPLHAGIASSARRAWYEERTSGPASTRAKPIASPSRRSASNSSGA